MAVVVAPEAKGAVSGEPFQFGEVDVIGLARDVVVGGVGVRQRLEIASRASRRAPDRRGVPAPSPRGRPTAFGRGRREKSFQLGPSISPARVPKPGSHAATGTARRRGPDRRPGSSGTRPDQRGHTRLAPGARQGAAARGGHLCNRCSRRGGNIAPPPCCLGSGVHSRLIRAGRCCCGPSFSTLAQRAVRRLPASSALRVGCSRPGSPRPRAAAVSAGAPDAPSARTERAPDPVPLVAGALNREIRRMIRSGLAPRRDSRVSPCAEQDQGPKAAANRGSCAR